jgi:hypothetical protein
LTIAKRFANFTLVRQYKPETKGQKVKSGKPHPVFENILKPMLNPPQGNPIGGFDFRYTYATTEAARKLNRGTVDEHAHLMGMRQGEPIIVMLDCLLQYALVYKVRYEGNLADDQVLGDYWLDALKAVRGLLNGDGAVAMHRGITTDSKSNGACEDVYWEARRVAGFPDDA